MEQNQIIEDLKQQARNNNEIADRNIRLTRENLRIKEELESYCHENMVLRRAFKRKYLVT